MIDSEFFQTLQINPTPNRIMENEVKSSDLPLESSEPLASDWTPLPTSSSRTSSSSSSSPLGSPLPEPSRGLAAARALQGVAAVDGWMRLDGTRPGVEVERTAVVSGGSMDAGWAAIGGGMAYTMLEMKGSGVVVMTAVEAGPGVVGGGLGVGRSAGSEMLSGEGKGRKQGMDEWLSKDGNV